MGEAMEAEERPKFRDIRRYFCEFCGICRSKKTLITSHMNSHHKEEVEKARAEREREPESEAVTSNTCGECGASFKKHAYLLQHMQSHSLERPYVCVVDDCQASYRRKDHLSRHLLQHQGKTFKCPVENCSTEFSLQSNVKRHVEEIHDDSSTSTCDKTHKQHTCPEIGCGKVFKFASQLRKHEDSHVKLESVDVVCLEPGCMKHFTNVQCLQAHVKSTHQYMTCETCGTKQLKKNIKRHLRTHEPISSPETFRCDFKGCSCTFSRKSNLDKHKKVVHFKEKPFVCGYADCGMRFAYKHVRDNHEKTTKHVFTLGDFEKADEEFRSRSRGGRKRKCPSVEMLLRNRVTSPSQLESWLFMGDSE
uniref:C2H2-type domain-containing protein n=2 Tax=Phaseolus vulgaris TaxID=3885 RepID=V7BV36_PHAVU|nr:hypothetical protein PHAVU_005G025300g [Phaseolus vulgaris]ESW20915.1 hypothetical protein PHAVU_005G025300g [Phaseolus vulgaris]